jgi:hypothetical protein
MKPPSKSIVKIAQKHKAFSLSAWLDLLAFNYANDQVVAQLDRDIQPLLRQCDTIAENILAAAPVEFPIVPTAGEPLWDDAFGVAADALQNTLLKLTDQTRPSAIERLLSSLCHTASRAGLGTLNELAQDARKHLRSNMTAAYAA